MKKYLKRICAVVLALACACTVLMINVFAEEKPLYDIAEELYYGRNKLADLKNGKNFVAAYDAIGEAVKSGQSEILLENYSIPKDDLYMLCETYNKDHPEDYRFPKGFSYYIFTKHSKTYVYSLILDYYTGYDDYLFNRMAERLLDSVDKNASDYDKALMLYDTLQTYIEYDYDVLNAYEESGGTISNEDAKAYNAYGAIVNGKAICEGYAEAYQYLLQRLGIQCHIVTGTGIDGGNHEWNLVKLGGKYYYCDITWDDADLPGELHHNYFNVTTDRIEEKHIIDDPYGFLPYCTSTEMAYHHENVFTEYDAEKLAAIFEGDLKKTAKFYFAGDEDNFGEWWTNNYDPMFHQIEGIIPGADYSLSYRNHNADREYTVTVYPEDYGTVIGGSVLTFGDTSQKAKVEIFKDDGNEPVYTAELEGNINGWCADNMTAGDYTVRISKVGHKTKEYVFSFEYGLANEDELAVIDSRLFLLGDVNEDGVIDLRDIVKQKISLASGEASLVCDVNNDGYVDAYDLTAIIEKIL